MLCNAFDSATFAGLGPGAMMRLSSVRKIFRQQSRPKSSLLGSDYQHCGLPFRPALLGSPSSGTFMKPSCRRSSQLRELLCI